jgi:hypothetical protein
MGLECHHSGYYLRNNCVFFSFLNIKSVHPCHLPSKLSERQWVLCVCVWERLGFDLRVSHLQSRCPTAFAMSPAWKGHFLQESKNLKIYVWDLNVYFLHHLLAHYCGLKVCVPQCLRWLLNCQWDVTPRWDLCVVMRVLRKEISATWVAKRKMISLSPPLEDSKVSLC